MSAENPLVFLGIIPKIPKIGNTFKKLIDSPPWQVPYQETQEIFRKERLSFNKITQSESQKVKQISMILAIIDKFGPINTSQIQKKSGLSWDSVTRTLRLLHKKKIVKLKQPKQNKNNEKIYSLVRNRAIKYHTNLLFWKDWQIEKKRLQKTPNFLQLWHKIKKRLPDGWENFSLKTKQGEKMMKELHEMKLLMFNYLTGVYCYDCFENGFVAKKKYTTDGLSICTGCGKETFEDEYQIKNVGTNWRKWQVDKKIFKIKKKYKKKSI